MDSFFSRLLAMGTVSNILLLMFGVLVCVFVLDGLVSIARSSDESGEAFDGEVYTVQEKISPNDSVLRCDDHTGEWLGLRESNCL